MPSIAAKTPLERISLQKGVFLLIVDAIFWITLGLLHMFKHLGVCHDQMKKTNFSPWMRPLCPESLPVMEINENKLNKKLKRVLYCILLQRMFLHIKWVENSLVMKKGILINSGDSKCCHSDRMIIKGGVENGLKNVCTLGGGCLWVVITFRHFKCQTSRLEHGGAYKDMWKTSKSEKTGWDVQKHLLIWPYQ